LVLALKAAQGAKIGFATCAECAAGGGRARPRAGGLDAQEAGRPQHAHRAAAHIQQAAQALLAAAAQRQAGLVQSHLCLCRSGRRSARQGMAVRPLRTASEGRRSLAALVQVQSRHGRHGRQQATGSGRRLQAGQLGVIDVRRVAEHAAQLPLPGLQRRIPLAGDHLQTGASAGHAGPRTHACQPRAAGLGRPAHLDGRLQAQPPHVQLRPGARAGAALHRQHACARRQQPRQPDGERAAARAQVRPRAAAQLRAGRQRLRRRSRALARAGRTGATCARASGRSWLS